MIHTIRGHCKFKAADSSTSTAKMVLKVRDKSIGLEVEDHEHGQRWVGTLSRNGTHVKGQLESKPSHYRAEIDGLLVERLDIGDWMFSGKSEKKQGWKEWNEEQKGTAYSLSAELFED